MPVDESNIVTLLTKARAKEEANHDERHALRTYIDNLKAIQGVDVPDPTEELIGRETKNIPFLLGGQTVTV